MLESKKSALLCCMIVFLMSIRADPNPGFVVDIRQQIFTDFINKYFEQVLTTYGHIQIPEISASGINMTDIDVNITNPSASNVKFDFNSTGNSIDMGIINTSISVKLKWKYSELLSGTAGVSGPVKVVSLDLGFTGAAKGQFNVPQVKLNQFVFLLDKNNFKISLDCKLCPKLVTDLLIAVFKGVLLDTIESIVNSIFSDQMIDDINKGLFEYYPTTVNATNDIGVCLGLSSAISVMNDHIELPLDMTFFLTKDGYKRQEDGPIIPTYNPENPGEIMVFFSSYVTDTIVNLLNKTPLSFPFKIWFYPMKLEMLGPDALTSIKIKQNSLEIKASPVLNVGFFKTKFYTEFEAKLDASVKNGDDTNLLYITPQLKELKLNKFVFSFFGLKINFRLFKSVLNWFVEKIINHVLVPTFAVPQLPGFKLQTKDSNLSVQNDYVEFDISFDLSQGH